MDVLVSLIASLVTRTSGIVTYSVLRSLRVPGYANDARELHRPARDFGEEFLSTPICHQRRTAGEPTRCSTRQGWQDANLRRQAHPAAERLAVSSPMREDVVIVVWATRPREIR